MNTTLDGDGIKLFDSCLNNYELTALHLDKIQRRTVLGKKVGYCRFCKKSIPEVSFEKDAHAFPQFIGNNFLLSNYECDVCNELFSRTLENEMANFMKLLHSAFGVKGEKKIPTYKNKGVRFESDGKKIIIKGLDYSQLTGSLDDKEFSIGLISDKFIPIGLYKCLTKMALSIMAETVMSLFTKTLMWLQEEEHTKSKFKLGNLWVIYSQLMDDYKFPHMSATLLKKKREGTTQIPSFIFKLTYSKFSFQIYLPLCDLDNGKTFAVQDLNYLPNLVDVTTGLHASERIYIDCDSKEKCEVPFSIEFDNLDKQ